MDSNKPVEQCISAAPKGLKPEPPEGSCYFYIERKKRYCRFKPAKNSNYCAEHVTIFEVKYMKTTKSSDIKKKIL